MSSKLVFISNICKYLIIDDDNSLRTLMARALTNSKISVKAVSTVSEAWVTIEKEDFDLNQYEIEKNILTNNFIELSKKRRNLIEVIKNGNLDSLSNSIYWKQTNKLLNKIMEEIA